MAVPACLDSGSYNWNEMIWINNNNKKPYKVIGIVHDATNETANRRMMLYESMSKMKYVREESEFRKKFKLTKFKRFTDIKLNSI